MSKDDEDDEEDEEEEERRTRQEEAEEEEDEEATDIKSNNTHLAGGELYYIYILYIYVCVWGTYLLHRN